MVVISYGAVFVDKNVAVGDLTHCLIQNLILQEGLFEHFRFFRINVIFFQFELDNGAHLFDKEK